MTLKYARAMAGMTTWASYFGEDVDTALAIVTRALDGAEAERDAYLLVYQHALAEKDGAYDVLLAHANGLERDNAAARKLLGLFIVDCGFLHHAKADQHMSTEPCPVEARIRAAKEQP